MSEDEKPIKLGVYFHEKKGFAIAQDSKNPNRSWEIDKNKLVNHPFLRIKQHIVANGTGSYFFYRELRKYEYIGEL